MLHHAQSGTMHRPLAAKQARFTHITDHISGSFAASQYAAMVSDTTFLELSGWAAVGRGK